MENQITLAELQEEKEKLSSDIRALIKEFRSNKPSLKIDIRSRTQAVGIAGDRQYLYDELEIEITL
jgi:hypothetical protein